MKNGLKIYFYLFSLMCFISTIFFPWTKAKAYSNITPLELKGIMNSADYPIFIIDVRTPEEYKTGYIQKSINIPLQILKEELISKNINKNTKIILYCRSGIRSRKGAEILDSLGYKNVFVLGGIIDWPYETVKTCN